MRRAPIVRGLSLDPRHAVSSFQFTYSCRNVDESLSGLIRVQKQREGKMRKGAESSEKVTGTAAVVYRRFVKCLSKMMRLKSRSNSVRDVVKSETDAKQLLPTGLWRLD